MADDEKVGGAEAIAKAVADALARLERSRGPDDDEQTNGQAVPYHKFARANDRAKAAEEALAALGSQVQEYQTSIEARQTAQQEALAQKVGSLQARHVDDLALVDLGFTDPQGRDALRAFWGGLEEGARGDTPAAYWAAQVEAHKAHAADPEKVEAPTVPRTLAGYLPALGDAETKPDQVRGGLRSGRYMTPDARTSTAPPADLAEKIRQAQAQGDWAAVRKLTGIG